LIFTLFALLLVLSFTPGALSSPRFPPIPTVPDDLNDDSSFMLFARGAAVERFTLDIAVGTCGGFVKAGGAVCACGGLTMPELESSVCCAAVVVAAVGWLPEDEPRFTSLPLLRDRRIPMSVPPAPNEDFAVDESSFILFERGARIELATNPPLPNVWPLLIFPLFLAACNLCEPAAPPPPIAAPGAAREDSSFMLFDLGAILNA